jgi:hypothetical protein
MGRMHAEISRTHAKLRHRSKKIESKLHIDQTKSNNTY